MAYAATEYEVIAANGTEVASGRLVAGTASVSAPPEAAANEPVTLEVGVNANGTFMEMQAIAAEPRKIYLAFSDSNGAGAKSMDRFTVVSGKSADFKGVVATDQAGNRAADLKFTASAIDLSTMTANPGVTASATADAAGTYIVTISVPSAIRSGTELNVTLTTQDQPSASIVIFVVVR